MTEEQRPLFQLLRKDPRYTLDAYQFVRDALSYAHDELDWGDESGGEPEAAIDEDDQDEEPVVERHLTGQQLCEAIRRYAIEQYGYMAKVVLNSWGVAKTDDFGEIVYNLIRIKLMKKSPADRREDFNGLYDFGEAFEQHFEIKLPKSP
ncbi:Minf_1886 family protein [Lignipirellula cremea]|uniref:Uncharacterized protein n=1 Tax=Lignipirellula cremea TaxID=2528010 RepID=A0A518DQA0_9BACT|nr:Minf_1886 family protein [Lignipirellula cremea]QDU94006.1 hypothetical protein Pla8534_17920 [Lignipirellula cremea]